MDRNTVLPIDEENQLQSPMNNNQNLTQKIEKINKENQLNQLEENFSFIEIEKMSMKYSLRFHRVLIVDDSKLNRKMLHRLLKDYFDVIDEVSIILLSSFNLTHSFLVIDLSLICR